MIATKTYDEAINILLGGGVGVMPTDTVYGLVARTSDKAAVARFYSLKQRERKPGTVIAANVAQLVELGVDEGCLKRVEQWWPNPLSVIVPFGLELAYLHKGLESMPVRIPRDEALRGWLEQTGPLVTSSANHPGEPTAAILDEARNYFQDNVDFYVEGGDLSDRAASTIVRLTDGGVEILREGAIGTDQLIL